MKKNKKEIFVRDSKKKFISILLKDKERLVEILGKNGASHLDNVVETVNANDFTADEIVSLYNTYHDLLCELPTAPDEQSNKLLGAHLQSYCKVIATLENAETKITEQLTKLKQKKILIDSGLMYGNPKWVAASIACLELEKTTLNYSEKNKTAKAIEPIQWQMGENEIEALFDVLYSLNYISKTQYEKRFPLIEKHFLNKEGKPFKAEQLAKSDNRAKDTDKRDNLHTVIKSRFKSTIP